MNIPDIAGYNMFYDTAQDIVSGRFSISTQNVLNNIITEATREVRSFWMTAAAILIMALLSSTVGTLNSSLGGGSGARAAFFAFFGVISGLAMSCFMQALSYGTEVIGHMCSFMTKLTPVLIMSLFTCCKSVSAAAFEPVLSAAVYVVSIVIEKCLVPLLSFSAVLSVAGNISEGAGISGFIKTVKSVNKWLMALVITIFTGINAIYGFSASSLDAMSAKTIKFAVGSLVPVVGGFLSDTLDTVTTSASLIKNAVGVSGIVIMCSICLAPVIKLWVMQLMLKLCASFAEPVTDRRISGMLWSMSEAVTSIFGVVILTVVLFVINICIILRATA